MILILKCLIYRGCGSANCARAAESSTLVNREIAVGQLLMTPWDCSGISDWQSFVGTAAVIMPATLGGLAAFSVLHERFKVSGNLSIIVGWLIFALCAVVIGESGITQSWFCVTR